jgi:hypothetical protein
MVADTKGGAEFNKDWYMQGNQASWWWGIVSNVVFDHDLINLHELAVTSQTQNWVVLN